MHWIVQDNIFNESAYNYLIETLGRLDISHSIHSINKETKELNPTPEPTSSNIICMGSYSMRHLAKKLEWYPGVFDLELCNFEIQKRNWKSNMLNADARITTFGEAKFFADNLFIRPIEDSKIFSGKVMNNANFKAWQKQICEAEQKIDKLNTNSIVQLCPIQKIFSEHRFWIVKGEIITASTYKLGTTVLYQKVQNDSYLMDYVKERITEWQPHEAFVIDIADTENGLKVVEINTLNSSGFYAANIPKLVMSLEDNFSMENELGMGI